MKRMQVVVVAGLFFISTAFAYDWSTNPGDGSTGNPYQISTPEQMNSIGTDTSLLDKYFILTADIDMSAYTGTQYNIIGTDYDYPFIGTFDGNGHKISNLTYTTTNTVLYVGLFGYTSDATIKNLGVENVNLSTKDSFAGGLAGRQTSCTITNCYSTGKVTSSYHYYSSSYAGGLVGYQVSCIITNCYSTVSVTSYSSHSFAGGLVGWQESCIITNCYSTGLVTSSCSSSSNSCAGGLVGEQDSCTITNCYSTSTVTSTSSYNSYAGGLVGELDSCAITSCYSTGSVTSGNSSFSYAGGLVGCQYSGTIMCCYSTGKVTSYLRAGGLVGRQDVSGTICNCYSTGYVKTTGSGDKIIGGLVGYGGNVINSFWNTQTSGLGYSAGGNGCTTAQLKQSVNYIGWNTPAQSYWVINEGVDYPRLVWQNQSGSPLSSQMLSNYIPGTGTTSDPYRISTPQQFNTVGLFPDEWNKIFYLENDIDLSIFTGTEFNRIGINSNKSFGGVFDGNGYVIRNLTYTTNSQVNYVGLFGYANNATIKNLDIENVNITTEGPYVGGLVGYQLSGVITNCYITGSITTASSSDSYAGGLTGYQDSCTITNCYNMSSVTSSNRSFSYAGGLVGYQRFGTVTNCYNTGSVISRSYAYSNSQSHAGGLVAYQYSGTLTNCYNMGSVASYSSYSTTASCQSYVGGLVGYQDYGIMVNCYGTGLVASSSTSTSSYAGGLVGRQTSCTITNCYSTSLITTTATSSSGGLIGYGSTGDIKDCFWDIETSNQTTSAGGIGLITEQMMQQESFVNWDFISIWAICEGTNYPRLLWQIPAEDWTCPDGVSVEDLNYFVGQWLENNCTSSNNYCGGADINNSGIVDLADWTVFAQHWLEGV